MDEILASIRRIIETGEERGGTAGAAVGRAMPLRLPRLEPSVDPSSVDTSPESPPIAAPAAAAPESDAAAYATNTVAFEAWGSAASPPAYAMTRAADDRRSNTAIAEAPGIPQRPAEEPLTDDDHLTAALESELAASWGQFDERTEPFEAATNEPLPSAFPATTDAMTDDAAFAEVAAPNEEGPDAMTEPSPSHAQRARELAFDDATRQEPPMQDRGSFEPANTDQRSFGGEPDAAAGRYAPFADVASPLSSQMTGTLVAASFEELAQAIRNGELKSLETMAQEMLRPMLQEWLDDNLPRMVERLVREEIERMSRGGRR
ncbi:DUF2497 domain-containing protein [Aureimonas sp. AU12]|uniref:DUF2497 domain-containing protein n=1 Tax=Aureimonas sp. AU12 TaxID=1638161 RepID=UPI000AD6C242|nr:DUF2497 domain-containing protein [Aureimonas sp. AU12]